MQSNLFELPNRRQIFVEKKINPQHKLSKRKQYDALGLNRTSHYYKRVEPKQSDEAIMRELDKEYLRHPEKGVLRMRDFLLALGYMIGLKRTRRLLKIMGLEAIYRKPNLSKLGKARYIKPYLLRGLKVVRPNQVWAIDITYIPMGKGYLYLTAIIDVYSRYIVGYGLYNSLEARNCVEVLGGAISRYGTPEIINSDQGSQFTSREWEQFLEITDIKVSMDGKGRAIGCAFLLRTSAIQASLIAFGLASVDNIFIERFWRTIKYEYIYLRGFEDGCALGRGIDGWMRYYNERRGHQSLWRDGGRYSTPSELYHKTLIGESSNYHKALAS